VVLNGYATAITVASPMIQVKNIRGRGVAIRRRCMMAVATSAAAAAAITYPAVEALPHAPSWRGARRRMSNSHRHTRIPTSAISAATTAVAAARPQLSGVYRAARGVAGSCQCGGSVPWTSIQKSAERPEHDGSVRCFAARATGATIPPRPALDMMIIITDD